MSIQSWVAIAVTLVTVWALIKRYETRLVLLAAGLFLCCISLDPMYGLDAMGKSMTNKSLIMAICGSMGFAFVASYTQCDRSLVHYLASPIRGLGIFLLPFSAARSVRTSLRARPTTSSSPTWPRCLKWTSSPITPRSP